MARYTFDELLHLLEQDGAAYDEARRRMLSNAVRFWKDLCKTAAEHPDPIVRARIVGIITSTEKVSVEQKREILEKLSASETHEVPLRSINTALRVWLRL